MDKYHWRIINISTGKNIRDSHNLNISTAVRHQDLDLSLKSSYDTPEAAFESGKKYLQLLYGRFRIFVYKETTNEDMQIIPEYDQRHIWGRFEN